jgi:hypothetical protein
MMFIHRRRLMPGNVNDNETQADSSRNPPMRRGRERNVCPIQKLGREQTFRFYLKISGTPSPFA